MLVGKLLYRLVRACCGKTACCADDDSHEDVRGLKDTRNTEETDRADHSTESARDERDEPLELLVTAHSGFYDIDNRVNDSGDCGNGCEIYKVCHSGYLEETAFIRKITQISTRRLRA